MQKFRADNQGRRRHTCSRLLVTNASQGIKKEFCPIDCGRHDNTFERVQHIYFDLNFDIIAVKTVLFQIIFKFL
jgi:hypothetical protein